MTTTDIKTNIKLCFTKGYKNLKELLDTEKIVIIRKGSN